MGRPEPCILFAQSFVHSQLDEYVDEVVFVEPVIITACEFLEQNVSPTLPNMSLIGATSPPSFALEIFVHCVGESRFRRLCQPFLYSHSSSNVLEVEAVVTNHLVVRGSYRGLTLVIYGNTAEDLGQFNVEFGFDSSLANALYSPSEGKLEDLPPALRSAKLTFEESISSLRSLKFPFPVLDITPEMKQFLWLICKIFEISNEENAICKVVGTVIPAVSSYIMIYNNIMPVYWDSYMLSESDVERKDPQKDNHFLIDAKNELFEIYKALEVTTENIQSMEDECIGGLEAEVPTSELLVDMFNQNFRFLCRTADVELSLLSQKKTVIIGLEMALLLCSSRESCYHFVNHGGMEKIISLFSSDVKKSTAIVLMLLGIVEFATRHSIGCEGFLGWWPREDENVPSGKSDGYCHLLNMLLVKQRHDVASLASYVLHRLRFYEIAARYEYAVLSVLTNLSADTQISLGGTESLSTANVLLKQILKLLTSFGPIEDPSPMASARRSSIRGQSEGFLSYKSTINIFAKSKCTFAKCDIDTHLLSLLKEKGFFPLSTALLSSPTLRSANGNTADIFVEIVRSIEYILLSLLFCRPGLSYLLAQPEATALMILCLHDVEDMSKTECMTLRQATIFLSKGFFCRPQEVGMITELHLRVGSAVDRLLMAPQSDELLWVLWELCAISRSDSGRQALLVLGHFPEAVSVLMNALCSFKDVEPVAVHNGSSLGLAIFHSAAEIFEVMVTDSTAYSFSSWIGHAVELHKVLHSSSPGSHRKDAPTRLLEWIDAGVVYHRNGAIGLLRYAAVLASGRDAHLSSTNVLVSDSVDVENVVGDSTNGIDTHVVDNFLGKFVSNKYFDGIALGNTSIVQLTASFRILAVLSENSAVAASLFEEGAVTVVYVVLVNCKFMLERLLNSYDYLVDEGAEFNSTSDLLLERSHEQRLLDLMIPLLVLLINLLRKLHESKEMYRNKKLLNALLKLHREVSPKLAACAPDLSFPYPSSALSYGGVCHLLASALACWPVFNWRPGLFHCVLDSVQATSLLALGPKDACSMLCLLGDLFPEEDIWLWKNEMPPLSALRTLSIATILGAQIENDINWYLQSEHLKVLLVRLAPQLDRIAQIVLHFAFTSLVVIQDMLRILIIRIACQQIECAVVLLRPIISWMDSHVNETALSDTDVLKVHRLLQFIGSLLEHPHAKTLLLKVGTVKILVKALKKCSDVSNADGKLISESRFPSKSVSLLRWSLPLFKSLTYIFDLQTSADCSLVYNKYLNDTISVEECASVVHHILRLCQVLPVGSELLACLLTFKGLISCSQGRNAVISIFVQIQSSLEVELEPEGRDTDRIFNYYDWRWSPPFFNCCKKLSTSLATKDLGSTYDVEIMYVLSLSALCLSKEGKSSEGVALLKCLFGLRDELDSATVSSDEKLKDVDELIEKLEKRICEEENLPSSDKTRFYQVKDSVKSMLKLLQSPAVPSDLSEGSVLSASCEWPSNIVHSVMITSRLTSPQTIISVDDDIESSLLHFWKLDHDAEKTSNDLTFGGLSEEFVWECPDSSLDRQLMPTGKRKMAPTEGSGRRVRDNMGPDANGPNISRGLSLPSVSSGPSRRDIFRQRKPNTSRPPSMHVDDYVARERIIDGVSSGSNIVSSHHRGSSTSGRPPSIHVDEFMARQRERQNLTSATVGNASQLQNSVREDGNDSAKLDRSQQLKADLDDDLQEINIIFDEESESDDRVPFPEPDDNLQPASAVIRENSPGSIVEETEGDTTENIRISQLSTPQASEDGSSRSDIPLRRSASRSDMPLTQDANISAEKKFPISSIEKTFLREQSDESKYASPASGSRGFDTMPQKHPTSFPSNSFYVSSALSSVQPLLPPSFYQRNSPQKSADSLVVRSQGYPEQKFPVNQPPLPPMPPPAHALQGQSAEPVHSQSSSYLNTIREVQPPLPSGYSLQAFDVTGANSITRFHSQSDNPSTSGNSPVVSLTTAHPGVDLKYPWNAVSSNNRLHIDTSTSAISARSMPPLPPLPPPFSTQIMQSSATNSGSPASLYNQTANVGIQPPPPSTLNDTTLGTFSTSGTNLSSYSLPPFTPSLLFNRPASVSANFLNSLMQQPAQASNLPQNVPGPQPSVQSMQPRPPPPPPPQLLPPHPQHPAPSLQVSQPQMEQMMPLQQSTVQVQVQPIHMPQQLHIPQLQFYYQPQQHEPLFQPPHTLLEQVQTQILHPKTDNTSQQQDPGMSLQQYFASPDAIESLLGDRDKLCQLLEQHPKLMQMLQERLGQQ